MFQLPLDLENIRLRFAAVAIMFIGRDIIMTVAQSIAMSKLSLLPRLVPSPQILLQSKRRRNAAVDARVSSCSAGWNRYYLNEFASALLGLEIRPLKPFEIRCTRIRKRDDLLDSSSRSLFKRSGPLNFPTILGVLISGGLLAVAVAYEDGWGIVAISTISLVAPLAGLANLAKLPPGSHISGADKSGQGDIVIRQAGKSGENAGESFDIVRCSRAVAEEVFFAYERPSYTMKNDHQYYFITALADVLLGVSMMLLALSTTLFQAYFIAGYAILLFIYGLTSTIPSALYLFTSPYIVEEEKIDEPESPTYTQALWKAIVLTKSINWVNLGDMAPRNEVWTEWLWQAREAAQIAASTESGGLITWEIPKEFDAQEKFNELLNAAHTASKQLTDQHDQNSEATNTRRFPITS